MNVRPLHWVFKIGNRQENLKFFRDILGMKLLRHEEFSEGCEATCNGPYNGRWSKTMIGYGPEDDHFVCELTYNYPIKSYKLGNDFRGMTIVSSAILSRAKEAGLSISENNVIQSPDGYPFIIIDKPQPTNSDPVQGVKIGVTNLKNSLDFWAEDLGMNIRSKSEKCSTLDYGGEVFLQLEEANEEIHRGEAYGRIAFSIPEDQQLSLYESIKGKNRKIINPLTKLPTPGKKTVQVIILGDPDDQEICFVNDEAFRELSAPEEGLDEILKDLIQKDKSHEWKGIGRK